MDLSPLAATALRPGAPAALRDERVPLSLRLVSALLDGRARLADISPDLVREARGADTTGFATLILPPGPGPARLEFAGRQFIVPAALRAELLAAATDAATAEAPTTARAASTATTTAQAQTSAQASTTTAQESAGALRLATQALVIATRADVTGSGTAAQQALATTLVASGTLRAARNEAVRGADAAASSVDFEKPVFDPRRPDATAPQLAARVAESGLFFESHVAQWARGERAASSVRAEANDLARRAAVDPARADARGTQQVETLQRQAIALAGPAWQGQPMQLELGRDKYSVQDDAEGAAAGVEPVFVARVRLELPHLGAVDVRLRLAGDRIAARVEGASAAGIAQIEAALPEFGAALAARGLRPVLLQAVDAMPTRQETEAQPEPVR